MGDMTGKSPGGSNKKKKKMRAAVRVARFEVRSVVSSNDGEDWSAVTKRWFGLCSEVKRLQNTIWQQWLAWHIQNDSASKQAEWLDRKAEVGAKEAGPPPVHPCPPELAKWIRAWVVPRFPFINSRSINIHLSVVIQGIVSRKAASGSLPGWVAILFCNESVPSFTKPAPVRFDKKNGQILEPEEGSQHYRMSLRLWRLDQGDRSPSIQDIVTLQCGGKQAASQVAILKKITSGEYKYCGSMLTWDQSRRKWFVMLSYQMPKQTVDGLTNRKATITCGDELPFEMTVGRNTVLRLANDGMLVAEQRRRTFLQRRRRAQNYRYAHTSSKGHGRQRVMNWRHRFQRQWNNFVKRVNHLATKRAVDMAISRGIGKIVYHQPEGDWAESRFLSTAGKDSDWQDGTTWEFFQFGNMLQYKCQKHGLKCEIVKVDLSKPKKKEEVATAGV